DPRDLGDGGFRISEEQLGAVLDYAAILLVGTREKSGHIFEGDERNVESIAEAHKARSLERGIDIEHARQKRGLVGDDAYGPSIEPRESDDDVFRVVLVDFEEVAIVHHRVDYVLHVVRLIGFGGNNFVE